MKLWQLLEMISDETNVIIADSENNEIARYDGKESIPSEYGIANIMEISAYNEGDKAVMRIQTWY